MATPMPGFQFLQQLPEELLQDILDRLESNSLGCLNITSRWCYEVATPLLWREVNLVDCRTQHEEGVDEHDDTPLIRKLLILATKPWLAAHVQTVIHRCHLPPPAIFNELPHSSFSSQTLSTDPRTIRLAELAVHHMEKVSTLRIIFGHPTLNDALLRCFFNKHRQKATPVRRLWLENCRISSGCRLLLIEQPYSLPPELDFTGLESIRFRRMPLRPASLTNLSTRLFPYVYARSDQHCDMQDGMGGSYITTVNEVKTELLAGPEHHFWLAEELARTGAGGGSGHNAISPLEHLYGHANRCDDRIYDQLSWTTNPAEQLALSERHVPSHRQRAELAYRGSKPDSISMYGLETHPSLGVAMDLLSSASQTLTSLTLDWVFTKPSALGWPNTALSQSLWVDMFAQLFGLRFPRLRAFQFRNAVVKETQLPQGLFLLDHASTQLLDTYEATGDSIHTARRPGLDTACLEFMEAHPNLQCLAWPMDHFFSERPLSADIAPRVEAVIHTLSRTLVDLRIDSLYGGISDLQTESMNSPDPSSRERRRRFVQAFASKLTKVESIKIEGGMPRDERRETIRALHACPLEKIVMIGISSPVGNTWGFEGRDLAETLSHDEVEALEGEDKDAIWQSGPGPLKPPGANFKFEADFGWPSGPPMIHTIASFHAETVTELKFCGYKGAPVLLAPTPITTPILSPLKHFHNLRSLIMSFWVSTSFEDSSRDADIISYWLNARSPTSTALVRITDEEPEGWEKELRTKYAPDALAWRVTSFIGPFLSEEAKRRKGGLHVRASFCIGDWGGIFDVDLTIGKGAMGSDVCLGFSGPREELEPQRRRVKLESRRWF